MKTGVVFITGFRQTYAEATGFEQQQRVLEQETRHRTDCEVYEVLLWKDDMQAHAAMLARDGVTHLVIAGYSYGGGFGAQELTKHALKHGIEVKAQILCDPVFRARWLPTWSLFIPFTARSIMPWACIKLDARVQNVVGVRQDNNLPKAHPIKWRGHKWELPLVNHSWTNHGNIDDSTEWTDLLFKTVDALLASKP